MSNGTAGLFPQVDFGKAFGGFSVPQLSVDLLVAAQRRNFEAWSTASQLAVEGMQAVINRQVAIAREFAEESSTGLRGLFSSEPAEVKLAQQADLFKTAFEKGYANLKEISEIVAKSNGEAAEVFKKRFDDSFAEIKTAIRK